MSKETIDAKYLILHGNSELTTNKIFQLSNNGPRILSKNDLESKGYQNPTGEYYLVFDIEKNASQDFKNILIDIRKLSKYESFRNSSKQFVVKLTEIMKAKNNNI